MPNLVLPLVVSLYIFLHEAFLFFLENHEAFLVYVDLYFALYCSSLKAVIQLEVCYKITRIRVLQ
jgi:hypothetical protein